MKSIVEQLSEYAASTPDKIAVIADYEEITYAQLWREIQGFAAYLNTLDLEKGSRIVVKASPSIWYAVSCFGIHLSGNVHAPVEKTIGAEGLVNIANEIEASVIISDIGMPGRKHIFSSDIRTIAQENYKDDLKFDFPTDDMTCDIMFTTGTTGKSKGVMESHRSISAIAENIKYSDNILDDNVYLIPSPINHAAGIRKFYASIMTGTTAAIIDGFTDVKRFYDYIDKYHVTGILMQPSAIRLIIMLSAKKLAEYADQIRFIHSGSAPLPEADKEKLCELLPNSSLLFAYGSSEAGSATVLDYAKDKGMVSCIGKPQKNARILIVDEAHNEIKSDKDHQGLIAITGDVLMQGYYNAPELTEGVMKDGVVYTNDIGYIDENGFVYMLGRKGDVINIGGLKIAPTEVENIVMRFPGIAECACFGKEDRHGNISLRLNIVIEKNKEVDMTELRNHMAFHLESYKLPKTISVVDEIPKTSNGKIDRKRLE